MLVESGSITGFTWSDFVKGSNVHASWSGVSSFLVLEFLQEEMKNAKAMIRIYRMRMIV
jgi:hypothetical protein